MSIFRPGRSFIQAAIGVLIGGVALGLLIVVIVKTQNAARRSMCQNNVKQIAIALENYRTAYDKYPTGTMSNPDLSPDRRLSWMMALVPYVESTPIYNQTDKSAAWDAERNRPTTMIPFRVYSCPMLERSTIQSSYPSVAGVGADAVTLPV